MIEQLIKKENIVLQVESVKDWKEAIHLSLEPLVKGGYCTDAYEEAVLKMTEAYGPYYVLCDEFALIHSNAFDAVKETQMAITTLKKPIKFSEDGLDVRVLVALVAEDGTKHMEGIVACSNIFSDEDKIMEIINATDPQFVYDMFIENAQDQD